MIDRATYDLLCNANTTLERISDLLEIQAVLMLLPPKPDAIDLHKHQGAYLRLQELRRKLWEGGHRP